MDEQRKKELVETTKKLTFEGVSCKVGGWANDYATITAEFPGSWSTSWETVERIIAGEGNFTVNDVQLISMRWHGTGKGIPENVKQYFNIPDNAGTVWKFSQ